MRHVLKKQVMQFGSHALSEGIIAVIRSKIHAQDAVAAFRHRLSSQTFPVKVLIVIAGSFAGRTVFATLLGTVNASIWMTIFLASALSSVVGFAFSAIAGAILFHVDTSYIHAIQTMLIASISLQSYSVFYLRRTIDVSALAPFLAGGMTTLLLGVYLVTHSNPELMLFVIGAFLIVYGAYTLNGISLRLESGGVLGDFIAGALGGITGPIAAFPGPFVTIWCSLKGWDKSCQRAVVQPYILAMQIMTLGAVAVSGGAPAAIHWRILQYAAPAIVGAFLGLKLFERLNDREFLSTIAAFLILSGVAMVAKAL